MNSISFSQKNREILKKYIGALDKRLNVIANNIANVDTPGFKRSDITFEAQLKRAIMSERDDGFKAKITNQKHIPFKIPISWQSVRPKRVLDYSTTMRNDGNNVDIDKEMTYLSKTTLTYQAVMDLLEHDYNLINLVLK